MRSRAFVQRHPALSYFVLTFAISWGGVLLVIWPTGMFATPEDFMRLMPAWTVALVAGPSLAGLLLTAIVGGRRGLRDLGSRLVRWRVGARWYAIALLTAPLYFLAVLLAMSPLSSDFVPRIFGPEDKTIVLLTGIFAGLMAGFFEELGWTGFAVPTLRRRHGIVATGLVVGVVWGLWHFLVKIWAAGAFGMVPFLAADLASAIIGLTAYRLMMVWVHDRTGSLLLAMLMHGSLTASTAILAAQASGLRFAVATVVLAVGWWLLVGAGVVALRAQPARATRARPVA